MKRIFMRQKLLAIVILATIGFSSFTANKAPKKIPNAPRWWDFNGGQAQMSDPYYYSIDPDNAPECMTMTGIVYCEIKAYTSQYDETIPDLTVISGTRYYPQQ